MSIETIEKKIENYYRVKALLYAPLAAPIVFLPMLFLSPNFELNLAAGFLELVIPGLTYTVVIAFFALVITCLIGYPVFLALKKLEVCSVATMGAAGALAGGVLGYLIGKWAMFAICGVTGGAVALAFWIIYTRRSAMHIV